MPGKPLERAAETEKGNARRRLQRNRGRLPIEWTQSKRYGHILLVSLLTLVMYASFWRSARMHELELTGEANRNLSATMFAPGAELLASEFSISNNVVITLTVSIYMLGLVCGPLIVGPLSELYGRLVLYHVCNVIFLAFTLACSASTGTSMFLVFRFLAGCAGSAPLTIGGGTIADVTTPSQRGAAMGLYSLGPVFGPCLGPIAGGFVAQSLGWRWTFRVLAIVVRSITNCIHLTTQAI